MDPLASIPKYALPWIDAEIIRKCVVRTVGIVDSVVLDWKGIKGEHKPKIVASLEKLNVPSEKV